MAKKKLHSKRRKAPAHTARPSPKSRKKIIRHASREHIETLTLTQINRTLVDCGGTKAYAARRLGISPSTLTRLRQELLAQQADEHEQELATTRTMKSTLGPEAHGALHAFDLPAPRSTPSAPEDERNPVTGEPLESPTPPDLGPDSDEESEPVATDDPTPLPPSSGGCNDKV